MRDGLLSSSIFTLKQPLIWGTTCNDVFFYTAGNIFLYSAFHLTVSGSDFWDHSVPSYFLPPWPWAVRPKCYFLDRPLIFSPGDVSRYFLPPILSSSGCSAEQALPTRTLFTAVSQVSDLNSPCSWLHFLKPSLHILLCCTICGATPHALELLAVILYSAFIKLSRSHSPGDGGRL